MKAFFQEFAAMLIGLVTGIAAGFFYSRNQKLLRQRESRHHMIDNFHKEVRPILLEATRSETLAANAILLHMHNGGPAMAAGMRQYSSVVEECPREATYTMLVDWQNVFVDREYRELITELQEKQSIRLLTTEMDDGLLRRRYESMGFTASILFWCYESAGGPYYLSFPTDSSDPLGYLGDRDFARLEGITNRVRNILRNYEKAGVLH